jgi:hypothetical protein
MCRVSINCSFGSPVNLEGSSQVSKCFGNFLFRERVFKIKGPHFSCWLHCVWQSRLIDASQHIIRFFVDLHAKVIGLWLLLCQWAQTNAFSCRHLLHLVDITKPCPGCGRRVLDRFGQHLFHCDNSSAPLIN